MFRSHLFLQVKAGGEIPSAFPFWRQCMNKWFMDWIDGQALSCRALAA